MRLSKGMVVVLCFGAIAGCSTARTPIPLPSGGDISRAREANEQLARDCLRVGEVARVGRALDRFRYEFGFFPKVPDGIELGGAEAACLTAHGFAAKCQASTKVFVRDLLSNPTPGGRRLVYQSDGATYELFFALERGFQVPDGVNVPVPFTSSTVVGVTQNRIGPGTHVLTPDGIDPEPEPVQDSNVGEEVLEE